jgi:DNA mismatch repair protein MutS2
VIKMFMDDETKVSLDFQYILNDISTLTPYGTMYKSRLKAYLPGEEEKLKYELEKLNSIISIIKDTKVRKEFINAFSHIKDLRTSIKRAMDRFILTEVELFEIKNFLFILRDLDEITNKYNIPVYRDTEIIPIKDLERKLDPENTGISTFYIYDMYSKDLKEIRENKRALDREIRLKKKEIKELIKRDLKLDLRPDGSVVIPKAQTEFIDKIKNYPNLVYISETYMNVKFSIRLTDEITTMERQVSNLKEEEEKEELLIRERLSLDIKNKRKELFKNISNIGRLDLLIAKARYAIDSDSVKPEIDYDQMIEIIDGVHPKVKEFLESQELDFTPINISLKRGAACITGANMGGKTISLKMVGLLSAMAQYGLFVPAKAMKLSLNNFIKTSIGDMQSTDSGLSTFGGETKTVQEAIEQSDNRGLILIDEIARGTNPQEGYAISKAIVNYLKDRNSISLLTTHYDNVANMEEVTHLQVVGLSRVDIEDLQREFTFANKMEVINKFMDYNLMRVKNTTEVPKDAINIAKIMGLDEGILKSAEKYLIDKTTKVRS